MTSKSEYEDKFTTLINKFNENSSETEIITSEQEHKDTITTISNKANIFCASSKLYN